MGDADISKVYDAIHNLCTDQGCDEGSTEEIPFTDVESKDQVHGKLTITAAGHYDSADRRGNMTELIFQALKAEQTCEERHWTPQEQCCSDTFPPRCKNCPGEVEKVTHCSMPNFMQVTTWSKKSNQMGDMKINVKVQEEGNEFDCDGTLSRVNDVLGPFAKEGAAILGALKLLCG
jgi:hypothetical protein